jgi:hypothetical protein
LNLFKEGNTYDEALTQVYGFDQDGLDALWQKYITSQTQSQSELQHDSLWGNSKDRFLWDDILGRLVTADMLLGVD